MVKSNFPPESQQWGRDIEKRLHSLETASIRAGSALKSNATSLGAIQKTIREINTSQKVTALNYMTSSYRTDSIAMLGHHSLSINVDIDPRWRGAVEIFVAPESYVEDGGNIGGDYELRVMGLSGYNSADVYIGQGALFLGSPETSSFQSVTGVVQLDNWRFGEYDEGGDIEVSPTSVEISCNVTSYITPAEIAFNVYVTPRLNSIGD